MNLEGRRIGFVALAVAALLSSGEGRSFVGVQQETQTKQPPTFYRDVLPVLQRSCQSCHRTGGIAPMPFETYKQSRPYAVAIKTAAQQKIDAAVVCRSANRQVFE
jgi:hypothetical protein